MQLALVTGASGFLGKHIVSQLSARYTIDTLGRNKTNDYCADLSFQIPEISGDYDLVIHAAAKAHQLNASKKDATGFFAVNEFGTHRLCQAFDKLGNYPKQFVFISTVAVYGLVSGELINELAPLNGVSPYAKSKINAELFLTGWCLRHNITLTIFRVPLIVGDNPPGNLGVMIEAIRQNKYYNIGKGSAKKSMVLADDIADSIPAAAAIGGTYNLTDGYNPTMAELASVIAKQLGKKPIKSIPLWVLKTVAYAGDLLGKYAPFNIRILQKITATLTFDDSKAKQAFGWRPKRVVDYFTIN